MCWINADGVHAEVIQRRTLGDWSDVELVAEPVCQHLPPHAVNLPMEVAISIHANGADPKPAVGSRSDLGFESRALVLRFRSLGHDNNHTTRYTEYIGRQLLDVMGAVA